MNDSSYPMSKKRMEWDINVEMYPDPCGMVGRPVSSHEFSCLIEDIKEKLNINSIKVVGGRFLDVGCGNSFLLSKIKNGMMPFGIDFSVAMIKKAREIMPEAGLIIGEINALPYADNVFDRVLCYNTFHHFPSEEYAMKTIKELVRVCKEGGYIMIGDIPSSKHKNKLTVEELKRYSQSNRPGIHRLDKWMFYDLEILLKLIESLKCAGQILYQPKNLKSSHYRLDIAARKL